MESTPGMGSRFLVSIPNVKSGSREAEERSFTSVLAEGREQEIRDPFAPDRVYSSQEREKLGELLNVLEEEMVDRWAYLSEVMIIRHIEEFAEEIIGLGDTYGYEPLRMWGKMISKQAKTFDMASLPDTFKCFRRMMDHLSGLMD